MSNCNACGNKIQRNTCMICSKCEEVFDLTCINITEENYKSLTKEFKNSWQCPRCICSLPKGDNTLTPVRITLDTAEDKPPNPNPCVTRGAKTKPKTSKESQQ